MLPLPASSDNTMVRISQFSYHRCSSPCNTSGGGLMRLQIGHVARILTFNDQSLILRSDNVLSCAQLTTASVLGHA